MRVLITGATGFLGSHLCRRMVTDGHEVRILSRAASNLKTLKGLSVEQVIGDVRDPKIVKLAVQDQQWVIHAAASLTGDRASLTEVNVEGTRHVAQACRNERVKRLIHISSVAAIGIPTDPQCPANEDFPFNQGNSGSTYHLSKRRAEEEVFSEINLGLDAVIVDPAFIFGPHGARYRGAEMFNKVRRNKVVPYFRGGICVVHVEDVVKGILAALWWGMTGHRYILGGENLTFRSLLERAAEAMNLRRVFVPLPPAVTGLAAIILETWGALRNHQPRITYEVHRWATGWHFYDSTKARQALGYLPRDFDTILNECLRLATC